ncbi:unnamed protein product (macronuclear) [Paramecium tetraurelia]|uniref:VWFA domain-containing protein n=1 Tax=Paramecium tetraurelia TaxID=5888 RepID=A0CC07_PARTE|nr:uncharacterized protein GSPATT00037108001 [Paramecium tetraurelia]CAK68324.1 unnamed protein product [Paramecium tetraurelia]|eukprot:XP_001435721.1 hypothetical protein (macronuclear) [Paramecium tetraurelia strain d4-2]
MDFQAKLKLSILILFVPVGFIALLQIITLNVIFITNFSDQANQLSFAIYNETTRTTLRFSHKLETINLGLKANVAFILQDLMTANQDLEFHDSLQQIQTFLYPLIRRGNIENFKVICKDSFEYSMQQIPSQFESWNSSSQVSVDLYQQYFRFILNYNHKYSCNIQLYQSILNLVGQTYRYANSEIWENQLNYFMINEQFYQFRYNEFFPIERSKLEEYYGQFLEHLLVQQDFDDYRCLRQDTLIQYYQQKSFIYGWFYSIQKQHTRCEKQQISKILAIKIFDIEKFKQLAGSSQTESDHNVSLIIAQAVVSLTFLLYVWTTSIKVANSFCLPLQRLALQLQNPQQHSFDSIPLEAGDQNCKEISSLHKSLQIYLYYYQLLQQQHFYSDQDQGSHYLMTLSQLSEVYKYHKNNWQVSVCANNIAQIHLKNKRYIEALKFQVKSVILGFEEYTSIKQIEKIRKQLLHSQKSILIQLRNKLTRFVINKLAGSTYILHSEHLNRNRYNSFMLQNSYKQSEIQQIQVTERLILINQKKQENSFEKIGYHQQLELEEDRFKEEKRFYKLTILFRKYTFCRMLYKFCIKEQPRFLNEAICSLTELYEEISNKSYSENRSIIGMKIQLLIMKFSCYQKLNLIIKAKQDLYSIKILYEQYIMLEKSNLVLNGFDIFQLTSKEIIQNAIRKLKICLLMKHQQYQEASEKCIKIIRKNSQNIHKLNSFAYKTLQSIFMKLNLNQNVLQKLYLDINPRMFQIFFLIDYSSKVSFEQIQVSHSICAYILQKLINLREVGLYIFNDTLYEMLSASQSIKYRKFLLKQFERFQIMKGGECKVLESLDNLLEYRLNQFSKQSSYDMNQSQKSIIIQKASQEQKGMVQSFVCVFSEFSICVDEDLLEKIQKQTQRQEINLVLFNIANSNRNHEQAKNLAKKMSACYLESEVETIRWISHLNQSSIPIHTQGYVEFL